MAAVCLLENNEGALLGPLLVSLTVMAEIVCWMAAGCVLSDELSSVLSRRAMKECRTGLRSSPSEESTGK